MAYTKEQRRTYDRKYRIRNRDRINELQRKNQKRRYANNEEYREYMKERARQYAGDNPLLAILRAAKQRAKIKGFEFDLTIEDIVVPEYCPVLGIKLKHNRGGKGHNSPSLDRIDNHRGYTKDNIIVVSDRANRLKNDATMGELQKIVDFYSTLKE